MSERPPNKILLILRKEWLEIRQQRGLMLGMIVPPLVFTLLPLGMLAISSIATLPVDKDTEELIENISKVNPAYRGMSAAEAAQALVGQQFGILFLLLPTILSNIIASYSVVGEKNGRTLEPLLATPVRTMELLVAKSLTALLPAVIITWVAAALFVLTFSLTALSSRVVSAVVSPGWLVVLLLCTPLLALVSVAATVAVSSRMNDARSVQQISVVLILPIMLLFLGQIAGLLVLDPALGLAGAAVLAVMAAVTIWIAVKLFQRDVILTRWT